MSNPAELSDYEKLAFQSLLRIEERLQSIDETANWFRQRIEAMDRINKASLDMAMRERRR